MQTELHERRSVAGSGAIGAQLTAPVEPPPLPVEWVNVMLRELAAEQGVARVEVESMND